MGCWQVLYQIPSIRFKARTAAFQHQHNLSGRRQHAAHKVIEAVCELTVCIILSTQPEQADLL